MPHTDPIPSKPRRQSTFRRIGNLLVGKSNAHQAAFREMFDKELLDNHIIDISQWSLSARSREQRGPDVSRALERTVLPFQEATISMLDAIERDVLTEEEQAVFHDGGVVEKEVGNVRLLIEKSQTVNQFGKPDATQITYIKVVDGSTITYIERYDNDKVTNSNGNWSWLRVTRSDGATAFVQDFRGESEYNSDKVEFKFSNPKIESTDLAPTVGDVAEGFFVLQKTFEDLEARFTEHSKEDS